MSADSRDATQVQGTGAKPLQVMRSAAGLHPALPTMPHLLPGTGFEGSDSWRGQVELVSKRERGFF
jgi:hypothetical protein